MIEPCGCDKWNVLIFPVTLIIWLLLGRQLVDSIGPICYLIGFALAYSIVSFIFHLVYCKLHKGVMKTVIMTLLLMGVLATAQAFQTEASYFTYASCIREGTSGIMADGRKLNDNMLICASWDYRFGTRLRITNLANNKSVVVEVADRGPNKKLYKKGRKIDLSKMAFSRIAELKEGIINVSVEVVE